MIGKEAKKIKGHGILIKDWGKKEKASNQPLAVPVESTMKKGMGPYQPIP